MASASSRRKRKNNDDDDPSSKGDKKRVVSTSVEPPVPASPSECFLKYSFFVIDPNNPVKTTQQIVFACLGGIVSLAALVDSYISIPEHYYRASARGHPKLRGLRADEITATKNHREKVATKNYHSLEDSPIFGYPSFRAGANAFQSSRPLRFEHFLLDGLDNAVIHMITRWKEQKSQRRFYLRHELLFVAVKRHGPQNLLTAVKEGILHHFAISNAVRVFVALSHFEEAAEASSFCKKEDDSACKLCKDLRINHQCNSERERELCFIDQPSLIEAPLKVLEKLKKEFDFEVHEWRRGLSHFIATGWRFDVLWHLYLRFPEEREMLYGCMIVSAVQLQHQDKFMYTLDTYVLWYLHVVLGYPYRDDLIFCEITSHFVDGVEIAAAISREVKQML